MIISQNCHGLTVMREATVNIVGNGYVPCHPTPPTGQIRDHVYPRQNSKLFTAGGSHSLISLYDQSEEHP